MKSSTIIFLLVLFVCCGANNFLRVIGNDYSEQILWEKPRNPSVHPFPITSEAALGGDQGILYQSKKENDYRLEARGPFFKENWITFLVYVDHWTFPSNSADTHYLHNFMNLSIGEPIKNKQPSVFLQGKLYSSGDTIYLNIRSHFSINTADIHEINIPISLKTIHIVEICLSSGNSDAMGLSMFVDKEQKYVIWKKYPFAKDFTEINLHSYKTEAENHISLFLDEFVLSNRRLQSTPAAPISAGEDVTNENVRLYCKTADNAQVSSIHNATCWILKKNGDTLLPLYVSEEVDTSLLYQRNIPFELDSGWYEWYCYFINNDGLPGKASARRKFNIATSQTTGALRVMDIYPSIPNESEEAAHLEPGEWYDWHIKSEKPFLHKDISYWLINISNPLYKFGHPGNKGGAFVCSLNVVYNISMTENGKWLFYEKKDNGSLKSIRVFPGTRGFLLDDTPETFKISHEEGYLRFRGMIPIEAIEGDWVVSVHAVDVEGKNTNILRKPVKVSRKPLSEKRRGPLLIVVIIFVSLSVLAVLFRLMKLKRKEKNGSTQDPSFEQVREYVVANIDKDLSLKSIAMNRSMSVKAVQDSLKRNGFKTLPAFMNKVRVEKAAVLLESPNLTVSEIGYSVGYDNSEYFSRIFREIIGITPSEYRKKFIS